MSQTIKPAAIRKSFSVRATPQKAFEVFTEGFDRWWPKTHYIGSSPLKTAVLEPGVGGRWYGLHEDGSEGMWGEVLAWDPPRQLVLAWRISHEWGYDPNLLTEVAGSKEVELQLNSPVDLDGLRQLAAVEAASVQGDVVHVVLSRGANPAQVLAVLNGTADLVSVMRVRQPNLGDLFLKLTGVVLPAAHR